jgi:hypothetical protein
MRWPGLLVQLNLISKEALAFLLVHAFEVVRISRCTCMRHTTSTAVHACPHALTSREQALPRSASTGSTTWRSARRLRFSKPL